MPTTQAFDKIIQHDKRIALIYGGQGAGKTYAICQIIANECTFEKLRVFVIGAEKTKLNLRALNDMKNILSSRIARKQVSFTQNSIFKFANGSEITFIGLDKKEVGKSIRSDVVYFNELNEIKDFDSFDHFVSRSKRTFADFNPSERFFIDKIREQYGDDIAEIKLTWKDNHLISAEEKARIQSYKTLGEHARIGSYSRYMYEVYYLGNYSEIGGGIFENIYECSVADYDAIDQPEHLGIDFGDNSDPNAIVGVKFNGGEMYVREYFYQTLVPDSHLAEVLIGIQKPYQTIIYETATAGHTRKVNMFQNRALKLYAVPVKKKSVTSSLLDLVKYDKIHVVGENAVTEFKSQKMVDGEWHNSYGDHIIDAARYVNDMKSRLQRK